MKSFAFLFSALLTFGFAVAQQPDSLGHLNRKEIELSGFDLSANQINNKIDSFQLRVNGILNAELNTERVFQRIRERSIPSRDSLRAVRDLDSIKNACQRKIDTLSAMKLPIDKYKRRLDSISQISVQAYLDQMDGPIDLHDAVAEPLEKIDDMIPTSMNQLPNPVDLESLNNTKNPLSAEMEQLAPLREKIGEMKNIPQQQFDRLKSIDHVQAIESKADQVNGLIDNAQACQEDLSNIAHGDLDVNAIPQAIENKVASLVDIKQFQSQMEKMNQYQEIITKGRDPEAMKELAKQQAVKHAMDHFAGQQEALKAALAQMSKLKSKYPRDILIDDFQKGTPNEMKAKQFIDRIVPGLTLQVQKSNTVLVDMFPSIGYRVAGRLTVGGGWNERISFTKWNQTVSQDRIWGPRLFTGYVVKEGFALRCEVEEMNVHLPASAGATDGSRGWVWSVFVGIKKDYVLHKNIKGNVQLLYNLYDDHDNSPYVDRFNVRVGFEMRGED